MPSVPVCFIPCYAILCCAISCCAIPCDAMPYLVMPCSAVPYCAMLCCIKQCHAVPLCAMLFHTMQCHAMLHQAVPCRAAVPRAGWGCPDGNLPRHHVDAGDPDTAVQRWGCAAGQDHPQLGAGALAGADPLPQLAAGHSHAPPHHQPPACPRAGPLAAGQQGQGEGSPR